MDLELLTPRTDISLTFDDVASVQVDENVKPSILIKQTTQSTKKKPYRKRSNQIYLTCCNIIVILFSFSILTAIICLITVPNQYAAEINTIDLMSTRNDLYSVYITLRDMVRLAVENHGNYSLTQGYNNYNPYRIYLSRTIVQMGKSFPNGFTHPLLQKRMESYPIFEKRWGPMILKTFSKRNVSGTEEIYLNKTLQQEARDELYSSGYAKDFNDFQDLFFDFLESASSLTSKADSLRKDSLIISISLICLSFFVLLPTVLVLFIFAIRNEKENKNSFNSANNALMKDTMSDESSRMKFKTSCQNNNLLNEFLLLEKIQFYKDYSEESLNLQMKLYEVVHHLIGADIENEADSTGAKACKEIEIAIIYMERLKYETVMEIMDIYEISAEDCKIIDMYNNREDVFEEIDLLPPTLFQQLAKDLTETLAETHISYLESKGAGNLIDLEDIPIHHHPSV